MSAKVLDVKNLKVMFKNSNGFLRAVEGVDLFINAGESVAIVGESGCGKSVTASSLMKLLATPPAIVKAEKMTFCGEKKEYNLLNMTDKQMQPLRGEEIAMIFQDPQTTLNPVISIGEQVSEMFIYHRNKSAKESKKLAIESMKNVGLTSLEERFNQFPHQLSGGQKQRILIAMATALSPKLLIADEPTTALDVTVQWQILQVIKKLQKEKEMALLLITHDLGVVSAMCERTYVMYCGKIVEHCRTKELLENPLHPYSKALIDTISSADEKVKRFVQIPKNVPSPNEKPTGCYFNTRCKECCEICKKHMPPLVKVGERYVRCWKRMGL